MANYISTGAYESKVWCPHFEGLMQENGGTVTDARYAETAENVQTEGGRMRPMAACEELPAVLPKPIEKLAVLYRRWYAEEEDKAVFIAASDHQLYWGLNGESWERLPLPLDWPEDGYQSNDWSCVSYEINPDPDALDAPIDVLLLSNAQDGMVMIRGDNMTVSRVPTPKKFGVIVRHAERIWGGAIENEPDMLVYSAPYDPTNWEADYEIPEDGAGDIQQPTWDGDRFTALVNYGGSLVCLRREGVWRVYGTDPGVYQFSEQQGEGTLWPKTVCKAGGYLYMLGEEGLSIYNGERVSPFRHGYLRNLWERVNWDECDQACAVMHKGKYILALPVDGSNVNNCVVIYNPADENWMIRTDISVESWMRTGRQLYFTSASTPGKIWRWHDDCTEWGVKTGAVPMKWESGWFDLGFKNKTKGSFTVYLTVECRKPVDVTFSIQTEKKKKSKTVTFQPYVYGKASKQKRMVFGGNGRRFRYSIESTASDPWSIIGGLEMRVETDED